MVKIRAKYDDLALGWVKGDVLEASTYGYFYDFQDKNKNSRYIVKDDFELLSEAPYLPGEITRRKIIPGTYGIVSVTKENKILIQRGSYSHDQLREAAHILNQVAEALEDETTK